MNENERQTQAEQMLHFEVAESYAGEKLGIFLRRQGISVTLLRRLKYEPQGLLINAKRARTNQVLAQGDEVAVTLPRQEEFSVMPQDIPLQIVYETPHVLVLDKPAGVLTHPTGPHQSDTLANAYCGLMRRRGQEGAVFRPVGRLDAHTTGLVVCAKTPFAAPLLAAGMKKIYFALVQGVVTPASGTINVPLEACPGFGVLQHVSGQGKQSSTEYKVLVQAEHMALVQVSPRTGRTHQIRAHFAFVGHPLLGDALYGGDLQCMQRHALHCAQLCFEEPQNGGVVRLDSPLPEDMNDGMKKYGIEYSG